MAVVSERSPRIDTTLRRHPLGTRARILLCSVFGPYARDDEYGSRALNPMELYHNQVTRVQGPFSLRMFHRSWGIMLIQANVAAPCAVLDFPTRDRFIEELRERQYDIVGITSIISNQAKVKAMCDLVREYQPRATIVVGGHIANIPDLADRIDADHIVRGEGVRWFREYLGESTDRPLRHPLILSGIGTLSLGNHVPRQAGRRGGHTNPIRRLPDGLQLLLHLRHVRRQGKVRQLLRDGRRFVRRNGPDQPRHAGPLVFRHG